MSKKQLPYQIVVFKYNEQQGRPFMLEHSHFTLELFYLVKGEATYSFFSERENKMISHIIQPGQFVIFKPFLSHSINTESSLNYYNVEFGLRSQAQNVIDFLSHSEYVLQYRSATKVLDEWKDVLHFKDNRNILSLLQRYQKSISLSKEEYQNGYLEIFAKQLFLDVIQCSQENLPTSAYNIYLKRALSYLSMNSHRNISSRMVSDHLNISETHLQRIFKQILNQTIMEKLNEIRVSNASELLLFSNRSIKNITESVGYNSQQAFHFNFKKIHGCSPKQYREQHLLEPFYINHVDSNYNFIQTVSLEKK